MGTRAITSPEQTLFRTPGQWSELRAAIFHPTAIYTARVNQTFSTSDGVLEVTYDSGSGTLASVLPDMTLLVGSSAGAHDIGICRIRSIDATKVYIGETSDIVWADNLYLTVIDAFGLWARHVRIVDKVPYMDGGIAYSNQHSVPDPLPIMGSHRVLKKTGATVAATFDWSLSRVIDGSAISSYAVSAPGSLSISGGTTSAPTVSWNSTGWKTVYLTLTAANGKQYFGVRYVFIWSEDDPPARAVIGDCSQDVDTGGWQFTLTLFDNVSLEDVMPTALVIVFAEDHYGSTQQQIGYLAGCENVVVTGWIGNERIVVDPEQGYVEFTAYTAHYWLGRIPSFPDGVELVPGTPTRWTEFQGLTVDKGIWHFLHFRTTATRVMDCFFSGDTKFTKEVSSLASNLWEQLKEMTNLQILARPGVNRYNQLFVQVHPQLIPEASRGSIPTVMTIEKGDWVGELDFERITIPETALVYLSGVAVNSNGVGTPYFSMAPGHAYPHYGEIVQIENLLLASQGQANTLCGLIRSHDNNEFPEIPITFVANNRMLDCFPNQRCLISIAAEDNVRGVAYNGYILPTSLRIVHDVETGYAHLEGTFEAETFESLAVNGDIPGGGDRSIPPLSPLPPLPPFEPIVPGGFPPSAYSGGPPKVLVHDGNAGLLYTENFDTSSPTWITVNAGLTATQYQNINFLEVCPNGVVYAGRVRNDQNAFLARAPSIGATFTVIVDNTHPTNVGPGWGIYAAAINPLVSEQVAVLLGERDVNRAFYLGSGGSLSAGVAVPGTHPFDFGMSYGLGKWLLTSVGSVILIAGGGGSIVSSGSGIESGHLRASTTGRTYHNSTPGTLLIGDNNLASSTEISGLSINIHNELYLYADCDPSGMALMTRQGAGQRGKSSDGGTSWAALSNLPVGNYYFRWAGQTGSGITSSRWIAAGAVVRLSLDFGNTWLNREGNINAVVAPQVAPAINIIRVVEY